VSEDPNDYNLPDDYFFVTECWGSRFYKVYSEKMTYNAAKTQCESDGAFLAIPRSEPENDYIADLIPNNHIWIGIDDIDQEGVFVAVDGSDITYTNWNSDQPNNSHNNENAVIILNKAWNDIVVKVPHRFVCSLRIRGMFILNQNDLKDIQTELQSRDRENQKYKTDLLEKQKELQNCDKDLKDIQAELQLRDRENQRYRNDLQEKQRELQASEKQYKTYRDCE